jgi:hypothetical protein
MVIRFSYGLLTLKAMKEAYDEYKKWETGNAAEIEQGYLKALEMYEQRLPYEQQIADSAPSNATLF